MPVRNHRKAVSIIFDCKTCPIHGLERRDYFSVQAALLRLGFSLPRPVPGIILMLRVKKNYDLSKIFSIAESATSDRTECCSSSTQRGSWHVQPSAIRCLGKECRREEARMIAATRDPPPWVRELGKIFDVG